MHSGSLAAPAANAYSRPWGEVDTVMEMLWNSLNVRGASLTVVAHSEFDPPADVWQRYLLHTRALVQNVEQPVGCLRLLVLSDGGGPDPEQRSSLNALIQGNSVRVAIVSAGWFGRLLLRIGTRLNPGVRSFAPSRFASALDFLELDGHDRLRVTELVRGFYESWESNRTLSAALEAAGA